MPCTSAHRRRHSSALAFPLGEQAAIQCAAFVGIYRHCGRIDAELAQEHGKHGTGFGRNWSRPPQVGKELAVGILPAGAMCDVYGKGRLSDPAHPGD